MEGVCPRCGAHYYGWALDSPLKHRCDICHVELKIFDDREHTKKINLPMNIRNTRYQLTKRRKKIQRTEKNINNHGRFLRV